jgi:hypothetical protein
MEELKNKLPGKTDYSGRRRSVRQKSGFKSHPDSTGGEHKIEKANIYNIKANNKLTLTFSFPNSTKDLFVGFGGYFCCEKSVEVSIDNKNSTKNTLLHYTPPNFSKFGSIWWNNSKTEKVFISFSSKTDAKVSLYNVQCGLIWHNVFDQTIEDGQKKSHLTNMHTIMPEAGFYQQEGMHTIKNSEKSNQTTAINLKSCNRCARFLPINVDNERDTLSFSNHCIAKAPCNHTAFGSLRNATTNTMLDLHFGYQLECRFCKKFFVNRPLNKKRSTAQMKEDGQRRRNFELLITELYQKSAQLNYRHKTGRELTNDVWDKFGHKCFKCEMLLPSPNLMHLDHTRPLALLWPLDETATALCSTCNGAKRDKPPSEFYSDKELKELSKYTGLSVSELKSQEPNHVVISELLKKLDWFYDKFLNKPELLKEKEGKITAELIVKALDKVLSRSKLNKYDFSFVKEFNIRRDNFSTR